ncbi:uncharacterized protein BDR25DRAFT_268441 [Lindgomyces ingoldianus]|uniref:Uncharacterized protein n=1 Tax=Lindgomyces ingoldianus TaxID=673940 RepID=A0ACB6QHZ2_9PLEO|nr:uncharacterized protein BDR25DRAFT_268441 [Lindgomyces ingoldianus]KAF2466502.1 hypothetical protein BDR25DRAFT_268441 [Lindgomyces ingoldianus]
MATTNGTLTPPSFPPAPSSPSLAKRKRSEAEPAILTNGTSVPSTSGLANGATLSLQANLDDILAVLKSYDTQPSILNLPLSSTVTRATSGESASKRTKLTPPDGSSSICSLVQDGSYHSLGALEKDVETAATEILSSIVPGEMSAARLSLADTKLQTNVLAFRKMLKTLVTREEARKSHTAMEPESIEQTKEQCVESIDGTESVQIKEEEPEGRTVLTLYGSAQGPKQLFSSLQQPVCIPPSGGRQWSGLDTSVRVTLPLRESSLPNIISTTQVFPAPEQTEGGKKNGTTFGELFAPANVPQLSPPKVTKPLTTRGNTVTFVPQSSLSKTKRKGSHTYTNQNLSTGQWLGYGGVDMPKDPTSPTAKQKSRQRALSTGEAQQPPSIATRAAVQQAKEDALFRSAYSSFAPSRDDSTAIVPEETKNKIWWEQFGEQRFNEMYLIDPALLNLDESLEPDVNGTVDESESFKEAVESFTPAEDNPFSEKKPDLEKSTDEVLQEISELLEILASHQRIRNSSLATNPRTPVIQNSSLASLAGSPSTPSEEEIDIYQMLKSQLTLMIAQLPPYAVAKLNGDQLDDLNISRTIIIETKEHKGVLEEDQASRMAKAAALSAAAGPPSLSRMASAGTSTSHYPQSSTQYTRPTSSVHSSAARPVQTSQTYYSQQQSVHRSPSVHYQRSSTGPTQSFQTPGGYASSTPRQSYPVTQGYSQQAPRASFGQTQPGQYYPQRPAQSSAYGGVTNSQYYQSTPQAQSQNRYPAQQTQNGFYQRPQNVAPMQSYNAAPSPHARTASPLKANQSFPQTTFSGASRPSYGTPVSGSQMRASYYQQPGTQYSTPQPPTPSTPGPTGYNAMSSNHQQMMLDRQQAQLAAQPQARMAAQNSFNRQGSGTPQPPNSQYGNGAPPMVA